MVTKPPENAVNAALSGTNGVSRAAPMVISATDSRRSNVVGLTLERKRVRTGSHAVDALSGSLVAPPLLQAGVEDVAAGGQPLGEPSSELSNVHVEHLPKSRQIRACPTTVE